MHIWLHIPLIIGYSTILPNTLAINNITQINQDALLHTPYTPYLVGGMVRKTAM